MTLFVERFRTFLRGAHGQPRGEANHLRGEISCWSVNARINTMSVLMGPYIDIEKTIGHVKLDRVRVCYSTVVQVWRWNPLCICRKCITNNQAFISKAGRFGQAS